MTPILAPINLFGSGKFGKKGDKGKESETEMASEVVDASTIQHDTKERVYFSKLLLVCLDGFEVIITILSSSSMFFNLGAFLDSILTMSKRFI